MFIIGVPAQKWITAGKGVFPRPATTKDLWFIKSEDDLPIFTPGGVPVLRHDAVVYFTFQGKNYIANPNGHTEPYVDKLNVQVEPEGFWKYLEGKGLAVASDSRWNTDICHNDVLGMSLRSHNPCELPGKGMSLEWLRDRFEEARQLLLAVGVTGDLELRIDQKWKAD